MKKILILSLLAVVIAATVAWAASIPIFGQDPAYSQNFTLLSTTTNTGNGSTVQLGRPYGKYTCIMTATTAVTPSYINFSVSTGINSSTLVSLATYTINGLPATLVSPISLGTSTVGQPSFSYLRGTYISSTTPTSGPIRVDCVTTN